MSKFFKTILALIALLVAVPALAAPAWTTYSASSFNSAQAAGKTIIVDIYADWCPTCKAQKPILDELRGETQLKDAVFVKVNFDNEKAFLRAHRIPRQSTILVFKGKRETVRSIAETNRTKLRAVVLGGA